MKRLYLALLEEQLRLFPCVAVIGPRQCGKTTLVRMLPGEWRYFDLERGSDFNLVAGDPDLFFRLNPDRVVLDEAQRLPAVFSALRVAIDADRERKGRFVITGSSSPSLLRSVSESLAGRISLIEMSPLLWSEVHPDPEPRLIPRLAAGMLRPEDLLEGLTPRGSLAEAFRYWFRGGYPEPWLADDPRFVEWWQDQYVQSYLQRDLAPLFPRLDPQRFRLFIRLLAGISGDTINCANIARALGVSQPTVRDYIEIAHNTFLWRNLPAWDRQSVRRLVKHPRGYLRDSGLLHSLLRIPDLDSLLAHPRGGASWEGMVIEEILRQFSVLGRTVDAFFYRTAGGAEVDLICEGRFGRIPFEIRRSQTVDLRDLRGIRDFMKEYDCPLGVVINNDIAPRRYAENLVGVPFTHL